MRDAEGHKLVFPRWWHHLSAMVEK